MTDNLISFTIDVINDCSVMLPIYDKVLNIVIDWGDGNITTENSAYPSHKYSNPDFYTIHIISGSFTHLNCTGIHCDNNYRKGLKSFSYNKQISELNSFKLAFSNIYTDFTVYFAPNVTNNVTNMSYMFCCSKNFNQSLSTINTSNVTDMSCMFFSASTFNQCISDFDTRNVIDMNCMFSNASAFNNGDIGTESNYPLNFNTSKVTNMNNMFFCAKNFNQSISSFDTTNVIDMNYMFKNSVSFNKSLSNFNTCNVTDMIGMFQNAILFNQSLSNFNTSKVKNMTYMFDGALSFNQDISTFQIPNLYNAINILTNSGFSNSNYSKLLVNWANQIIIQSKVYFKSGKVQYNTALAQNARDILTNIHKWIIIDGGFLNEIDFSSPFTETDMDNNNFNNDNFLIERLNNELVIIDSINSNANKTDINNDIVTNVIVTNDIVTNDIVTNDIVTNDTNYIKINNSYTLCFHEDTLILTKNGYNQIKNLRKGDLIKTLNHDYVPISMIGHSQLYNPDNEERIKNRLYKCTKDAYPEITEDLILTGMHAILVDNYKNVVQKIRNKKMASGNRKIKNKYSLLACVDERTIPYDVEGIYTIYNLALENENENAQYGIYANGLLVETASQRYIKVTMSLIE